jgi:hypothetical protein
MNQLPAAKAPYTAILAIFTKNVATAFDLVDLPLSEIRG